MVPFNKHPVQLCNAANSLESHLIIQDGGNGHLGEGYPDCVDVSKFKGFLILKLLVCILCMHTHGGVPRLQRTLDLLELELQATCAV